MIKITSLNKDIFKKLEKGNRLELIKAYLKAYGLIELGTLGVVAVLGAGTLFGLSKISGMFNFDYVNVSREAIRVFIKVFAAISALELTISSLYLVKEILGTIVSTKELKMIENKINKMDIDTNIDNLRDARILKSEEKYYPKTDETKTHHTLAVYDSANKNSFIFRQIEDEEGYKDVYVLNAKESDRFMKEKQKVKIR